MPYDPHNLGIAHHDTAARDDDILSEPTTDKAQKG